MIDKVYLYSEFDFIDFIKSIFIDYEVIKISFEDLKKTKFKNKKILFVTNNQNYTSLNSDFFLDNNIIIFSSQKEKKINQLIKNKVNYLYGPITLKKFLDFVKSHFIFNSFNFKDIQITGEIIKNLNNNLSYPITALEKKILLELFDKKKIKREYFLEKVLGVNKDIETKTIESHLTRIRKKLLIIKSKAQIFSREEIFFLEL